jgi:hypothetical protein
MVEVAGGQSLAHQQPSPQAGELLPHARVDSSRAGPAARGPVVRLSGGLSGCQVV